MLRADSQARSCADRLRLSETDLWLLRRMLQAIVTWDLGSSKVVHKAKGHSKQLVGRVSVAIIVSVHRV